MVVTGTREWSSHSCNVVKGCPHGCLYCFSSAMAARFHYLPAGGWTNETGRPTSFPATRRRYQGVVMFPTTHDLSPALLPFTLPALSNLLQAGNDVLVVSKPHMEVVTRLCSDLAPYRDHLLFRFTIGSASSVILKWWEPGAPSFEERLAALQHAHAQGFRTSVSCEPLLEVEEDKVLALVGILSPYVTDSIWLGKLNQGRARLTANGYADPVHLEGLRRLEASQSDDRIRALYARLCSNPLVRWKESIKTVVGLAGLDGADEGWKQEGPHEGGR